MRILTFILLASLAAPCHLWELRAQNQDRPKPVPPRPYAYSHVDHGHPADTNTGSVPCGYRGAYCPPQTQPQPQPKNGDSHTGRNVAIGVGVGAFAGLLIAEAAHSHNTDGPEDRLSKDGPQFSETIHMSAFQVSGFVQGGWPLVIDYETEPGTYAVLSIVNKEAPPYAVLLPTSQTGRQLQVLQIPISLGTERSLANFTVMATVGPQDPRFRYFRVFGFGCGRKALGSVAIDELKFGPNIISDSMSDTKFSFHAHTNFDRMKAEFMQMTLVNDCWEGQMFAGKNINQRIHEDDYWTDGWSGKKAHQGQIQFRARGWMTADNGGDWVSAFSPDLVLKQ